MNPVGVLRRPGFSPTIAVVAAFVLIIIVFFHDVILFGDSFVPIIPDASVMVTGPYGYSGVVRPDLYRPDLGASAWAISPWVRKVSQELASGTFPLWDDNQGFGSPLLANAQSGGLDPLRLPVLLSGSAWAWDTYYLARMLIGLLAAYAYARKVHLTEIASCGFSVAYVFSGHFLLFGNMHWVEIYFLLPVILLGTEMIIRGSVRIGFALTSIAIALSVLAGMPEVTLLVLLFSGFYGLFCLFAAGNIADARSAVRRAVPLAGSWLIGIGMSAPLLLPLAEFIPLSFSVHPVGRGLGLAAAPLSDLVFLVVPYLDGLPRGPLIKTDGILNIQTYVGASVLFLSVLGLVSGRNSYHRRLALFLSVSTVVILLKTYGAPGINELGRLPGLSLVWFPRWSAPIAGFCIALLAGLGIHRVQECPPNRFVGAFAFASTMAFVAVGMQLNSNSVRVATIEHLRDTVGVAITFAALTWLFVTARGFAAPAVKAIGCCALIAGELWIYAPTQAYQNRYDQYAEPPFVAFLATQAARNPLRLFATDGILYPNSASVFNLDDIRSLDALYIDRYVTYVQSFIAPGMTDRYTGSPNSSSEGPTLVRNNAWFDLAGVRYVITPPGSKLGSLNPSDGSTKVIQTILAANGSAVKAPAVTQSTFVIDGLSKPVLFEHPPASLRWPIAVSAGESILRFSMALSPDVWDPTKGDGVRFGIDVETHGTREHLYQRDVDPKNDPTQRHWIDDSVDLSRYAGTDIVLILTTEAHKSTDYDWAGWGDLALTAETTNATPQYTLVYDQEVEIFENSHVLPRAFLANSVDPVADKTSAMTLMKNGEIDPARVAVVETASKEQAQGVTPGGGTATIQRHNPVTTTIVTASGQPSFLVLTDSYYPGWTASIDGQTVPIYPTDLAFSGIFVPAGNHQIIFQYFPLSFRLGLLTCGVATTVLFGFLAEPVVRRTRERRNKQAHDVSMKVS